MNSNVKWFHIKILIHFKLSISRSFSPLRPPPVQMQILAKVIDQWDNICLHNTNSISIESIRINITSRWVFSFLLSLMSSTKIHFCLNSFGMRWDEMIFAIWIGALICHNEKKNDSCGVARLTSNRQIHQIKKAIHL